MDTGSKDMEGSCDVWPMRITAIFMSTLRNEFFKLCHHIKIHPSPPTCEPIITFIVLCSIIVHGLSIPGFSLGTTVHTLSRTWSRKDTGCGAPDWTN